MQDLPGALAQRHHVDALARLALAGGLPDALPVGRPVARGPEPGLVDERLAQHRAPAVDALPVVGEPPRRQGQRRGRKVLRAHPWKHQEARVDDRQVPAAVAAAVVPSDPSVPAREPLRHRIEQQTSQPAPLVVGHEVPDVRPEGTPVAEVVVSVDEGVPQLPSLGVGDGLQLQRTQGGQRRDNLRLRVAGGGPGRPGRHVADAVLPLGRQLEDAVPLQRLQHPEAGPDPVGAFGRRPVEMLADRLRELVAAVVGEQLHGLLDGGNLPPVQAAAREGGRPEVDDSLVLGQSPQLPDNSMRIVGRLSRALWTKVHRAAKIKSCQRFADCQKNLPRSRKSIRMPLPRGQSHRPRRHGPDRGPDAPDC